MLDSLGNTTAATGKGFAIGSAALTALALLASYVITIKQFAIKNGFEITPGVAFSDSTTIGQVMDYYNVTLMNPGVLCGIFVGVMLVMVFCALTMNAVGTAAFAMMNECRRQFAKMREGFKKDGMSEADMADPTSWPNKVMVDGTQYPQYAECVAISTTGAQKAMVVPSLLAIFVPILVGLVMGPAGVMGMLAGGLTCGFAVAIYMANAGGAWDNAKKYIEKGKHGGKGLRCSQGWRRRRYGRRSLQGHLGPVAEHPHQADRDRLGGLRRPGRQVQPDDHRADRAGSWMTR